LCGIFVGNLKSLWGLVLCFSWVLCTPFADDRNWINGGGGTQDSV